MSIDLKEARPLRLELKLSQKGLILVAFPLFFQVVFLVTLASLFSAAERTAAMAQRGERIQSKVGNIGKYVIESQMCMVGYVLRKSQIALDAYENNDRSIPVCFNELRDLTKDLPEMASSIEKFEYGVNRMRANMRKNLSLAETGSMFPVVMSVGHQATSSYFLIKKEIDAITTQIRKNYQYEEESKVDRQNVWFALILMLIGNVVISILAAVFFSKNIASRLSILADNAMRVKDHKALNPPISGGDEIAQLDKTFHTMSDALLKAEKTKAEFISMISHDLRSPLTSLQFTLALAEKGAFGEMNEKGKERFARADSTVQRLVKLINELLDIEKMEAGMLNMVTAPEDLDAIVGRALDSLSTLAETKSIKLEAPKSSLKVDVEADRIVQVLVNLISNAIKFSPESSTIRIITDELPAGVKVSVIDQGRGIPASMRNSIFERFSQVEHEDATTHGGTGLGLAICKAIIDGHKGLIGVDSEEGKGSTFWFVVQKC